MDWLTSMCEQKEPAPSKIVLSSKTEVKIASVKLVFTNPESAAGQILENALGNRPKKSFRFVNAFSIVAAHELKAYGDLLNDTNVNFSDSAPCSWIASLILRRRAVSSRGPSVFVETLRLAESSDASCFLLGTTDQKLKDLRLAIKRDFPELTISGDYAPQFLPIEEMPLHLISSQIGMAKSNLVFVSLGTPKQDFVAKHISETMGITTVAVGAAFDFYIGSVKEAPLILQNSGLEWLYRFWQEPSRLWRRYLIGNLKFLYLALRFSKRVR